MQGIFFHQKQQFEYLKNKSIIHTRALVSSQATPTQAMLHHRMCYIPSITYPTAVCHLLEYKLDNLQKPDIAVLLNKLHLSSKHDRRLVFAAKQYGGLGCIDLRVEAGLEAITNIVRTLRTPGHGQSIIKVFLQHW